MLETATLCQTLQHPATRLEATKHTPDAGSANPKNRSPAPATSSGDMYNLDDSTKKYSK